MWPTPETLNFQPPRYTAANGKQAGDAPAKTPAPATRSAKPSKALDTHVIYCGDHLEQLRKLPPQCVDLIYIDPPFNSNHNYEVFRGETKEKAGVLLALARMGSSSRWAITWSSAGITARGSVTPPK
jgi:hypothetical protein